MDSASSIKGNDIRNELNPNANHANDDINTNDTQTADDEDKKIPAASLSSSSHTDEAIARRFQKGEEWDDRLDRLEERPETLEPASASIQDERNSNDTNPAINPLTQEGDRRVDWKDRLRHEEQTLAALAHAQQFQNTYDDISDEELAKSLQDQEFAPLDPTKIEERKQAEERAMQESVDGRAWLFVKQVVDMHAELAESTSINGLSTVAVDDMVFLCKAFLECATDFQRRGIPSRVSLVYHYTKSERMSLIREHGLMTLGDRVQKGTGSTGRAAFGDGVYAASNPTAFRHFGDTGMIVAVILGNKERVPYDKSGASPNYTATAANTLIGNKRIASIDGEISIQDKFADELVLQESRQCLPLIQFDSNLTRSDEGREAVWKYHQELQKICDKALNGGVRTVLKRTLLPASTVAPKAPTTIGIYIAPKVLPTCGPADAFEKVPWKCRSSENFCAICRDSLCRDPLRWNSKPVVRLKVCGHQYHKACIEESLQRFPKCPTCRAVVRKPQGHSPSGAMSVSMSAVLCKGFEQSSNKSIVITYTIPSGIQKPYHENPGQPFPETTRVAYLPNNDDGRKLLKRLKYAFMQGLTFTVGTSLTTGKPNSVIWASIHHKTSPSGGTHGFPDPTFFARCNSELDSLGVPP